MLSVRDKIKGEIFSDPQFFSIYIMLSDIELQNAINVKHISLQSSLPVTADASMESYIGSDR